VLSSIQAEFFQCTHSVCSQSMVFRVTTDIILYGIKWPIFRMKVKYVYCEVETENLKIINTNYSVERVKRRKWRGVYRVLVGKPEGNRPL